jgi:hypothetical protein
MALGTLASRLVRLEQTVAQRNNTSLNAQASLDGLDPQWVADKIARSSGTQAEWQGTLVYAIPQRSCGARGGEAYDCRWRRWRHVLPGWWRVKDELAIGPTGDGGIEHARGLAGVSADRFHGDAQTAQGRGGNVHPLAHLSFSTLVVSSRRRT